MDHTQATQLRQSADTHGIPQTFLQELERIGTDSRVQMKMQALPAGLLQEIIALLSGMGGVGPFLAMLIQLFLKPSAVPTPIPSSGVEAHMAAPKKAK